MFVKAEKPEIILDAGSKTVHARKKLSRVHAAQTSLSSAIVLTA